jgi:hypothetical protein
MNRGNLADLTAFVAVADQLSFRAAASQLGVTPSALSHSMRQPGGDSKVVLLTVCFISRMF